MWVSAHPWRFQLVLSPTPFTSALLPTPNLNLTSCPADIGSNIQNGTAALEKLSTQLLELRMVQDVINHIHPI